MQLTVWNPIGAEVTDLDLADPAALTPEVVGELTERLGEHGVLVLPGQTLDDDGFLAFLQRFGRLVFTTGEIPLEGYPDLNVISNVGRTTPPRSNFHVDSSYFATPPAYTALRAVTIPSQGGETLFTNQYAAYETLPDDLRSLLAGRTITHRVTGLDLGPDDETEADHPVFAVHPLTGRTALYLSTPARCVAVSDMSEAESADVVARLFEHSTAEANTLRHAWAPGDVVMWDNRVVLHKADHADVHGDRVMHRGMVVAA